MLWQDVVLSFGNFVIAAALVETIRNKHKPEPLTCALDGAVLVAFVVAFATLGLYLSAIAVSCAAIMWFILLGQVLLIKRRKGNAIH